jgi:hypothetical protein
MKRYDKPIDLIIEMPQATRSAKRFTNPGRQLKDAGIPVESIEIMQSSRQGRVSKKRGAGTKKLHLRTSVSDMEVNPWDLAHISKKAMGAAASYIEPDGWNEYVTEQKIQGNERKISAKSFATRSEGDDYDPDWQPKKNLVWHLDDQHSQLLSARSSVVDERYAIRIAHFDTGYSNHFVITDTIRKNPLQRNFIEGEDQNSALDIESEGFLKQPNHGTGTLGILAGTKVHLDTATGPFDDYLGGAPFADIICCRISKSVILFKTSAFANALQYITQLTLSGTPVHVLSMSMGGAPSKSWADAVNAAYEAGIVMVTAAGNNINGIPTRHVVYPARFDRVIAACGVTFDYAPYFTRIKGEMQGNFGPDRHMDHAMAAFTPNTTWASVRSNSINFSGAGTSSATPQIAAAAAIYYRKYHQELDSLDEPWQKVEAIRNALYSTALKKIKPGFKGIKGYFGNGLLQANAALQVPVDDNLPMTEKDRVPWFPILATIFKRLPSPEYKARMEMFNTELAQLVFTYPEIARTIGNEKLPLKNIRKTQWNGFITAVIEHRASSVAMKKFLKEKYKR